MNQSSATANDRQEGGDHYKQNAGVPQHWDLVIMYNWDYFQSQITKYVMRWKTKHNDPDKQLEDLKKARHFLDKYIENFRGFCVTEPAAHEDLPMTYAPALDWQWFTERAQVEGYVGGNLVDFRCKKCRYMSRQANAIVFIEDHNTSSAECDAFRR